ncbi:hypothetical protein ACM91Z_002748 [Cronobacter dublinensis]
MNSLEAKVRIAELAADLAKTEMLQRPSDFKLSSSSVNAFNKHYDAIIKKVSNQGKETE